MSCDCRIFFVIFFARLGVFKHKGESLTFFGCIKISPNYLSKPLEMRIFSGNFFSKKSYICIHVHIPFHIDPQIWPHAIA